MALNKRRNQFPFLGLGVGLGVEETLIVTEGVVVGFRVWVVRGVVVDGCVGLGVTVRLGVGVVLGVSVGRGIAVGLWMGTGLGVAIGVATLCQPGEYEPLWQ